MIWHPHPLRPNGKNMLNITRLVLMLAICAYADGQTIQGECAGTQTINNEVTYCCAPNCDLRNGQCTFNSYGTPYCPAQPGYQCEPQFWKTCNCQKTGWYGDGSWVTTYYRIINHYSEDYLDDTKCLYDYMGQWYPDWPGYQYHWPVHPKITECPIGTYSSIATLSSGTTKNDNQCQSCVNGASRFASVSQECGYCPANSHTPQNKRAPLVEFEYDYENYRYHYDQATMCGCNAGYEPKIFENGNDVPDRQECERLYSNNENLLTWCLSEFRCIQCTTGKFALQETHQNFVIGNGYNWIDGGTHSNIAQVRRTDGKRSTCENIGSCPGGQSRFKPTLQNSVIVQTITYSVTTGTTPDGRSQGTCHPCPTNYYREQGSGQNDYDAQCVQCPSNSQAYYAVTVSANGPSSPSGYNTHKSACVCNSGYETKNSDYSTCHICTAGKYKAARSTWNGGTGQTGELCLDIYGCRRGMSKWDSVNNRFTWNVNCIRYNARQGCIQAGTCQICDDNHYQAVDGQAVFNAYLTTCSECPSNTQSWFSGAEKTNSHLNTDRSACVCNKGYEGLILAHSGSCTECLAGKYKTQRSNWNYALSQTATSCTNCENYKVITSTKASLSSGSGKLQASPVQTTNSETWVHDTNGVGCMRCGPGFRGNQQTAATTCNRCGAGTYASKTGDSSSTPSTYVETCSECTNYRVFTGIFAADQEREKDFDLNNVFNYDDTPGSAAVGCRRCKVGFVGGKLDVNGDFDENYNGRSGTKCQHCKAGKFAERTGAPDLATESYTEQCSSCAIGKFSLILQDECSICDPGYRTLDETGSADCIACPAGKKSTDPPSHQCESCLAGKFSVLASHQCFDCPAGKYSDAENSLWCDLCDAGKYSSVASDGGSTANSYGPRTSCEWCDAGKRSTIPPSDECHDCAAGKYSGEGVEQCTDCPAGEMSGPGKSDSCEKCAVGKYVDFERATVCYECVAGKFQHEEGQTTCEFCDSGQFMAKTETSGATTTCTTCPAGTYMEMINFTYSQSLDFNTNAQDNNSSTLNAFKQLFTLDEVNEGSEGNTRFIRVKMKRDRHYKSTKMMYAASAQVMKVGAGGVKLKRSCLQYGHEITCDSEHEVPLKECALDASEAYWTNLVMSTQNTGVVGCMRPNTKKECQLAIDREYTFNNSDDNLNPSEALLGCYCYETGTQRHECYFKHFDSYNNDHDDSMYDTQSGRITRPCLNKKSLNTTTSIEIYTRNSSNAWQNANAAQYLSENQLKNFLNEIRTDGQRFTQDCQQKTETECNDDSYNLDINCENRGVCALRKQNAWGEIDANWMFIGNDDDTYTFGNIETSAPDGATKYYFYEIVDVPVHETDTALSRTCQPYSLQACVASMTQLSLSKLELTNDALGCRCASDDCKYGVETPEGTFIQQTEFENGYTPPQGHDCHRIPVCRDMPAMLISQKPPVNTLDASEEDAYFIMEFFKTHDGAQWPEVQVEIEIAPYTDGEHQNFFSLEKSITRDYHPSCLVCQEGTYFSGEASNPNKATYVGGNGDLCLECAVGKIIALGGAGDAVAYPWDHDGEEDCVLCVDGKYQENTGQTKCTDCPPGSMQRDLTLSGKKSKNKCLACPPGMYQDEPGAIECKFCPAGKSTQPNYFLSDIYGNSDQTQLWSQVNGISKCVECPAGKFRTHGETQECSPCPPGSYTANAGNVRCTLCPEGKYSREAGLTSNVFCTQCGEGKFASLDRSKCSQCGPGEYNVFGICVECAPGLYLSSETERCEQCPKGKHAPDSGHTQCVPCAVGKYSVTEGSVDCLLCDRGQQHSENFMGCVDCETGKYNPYPGRACLECERGKFNAEMGAHGCRLCLPGKYADSQGALSCDICPGGKFQSDPGKAECHSCDNNDQVALPWACFEYNENECRDDEYKTASWDQCALRPEEIIQRKCSPFYNHTWDLATDLCTTEERLNTFLTDPAYMPLKWAHYPLQGVQDGVRPEPRFGVATSHTMGHKFRLVSWGVNSVDLFFVNSTNQLPELEDGSRQLSFVRIDQDTLNLAEKNITGVSFSAADRYLKIRLQPLGIMIFTVGDQPELYFAHENASDAVFQPNDEQLFLNVDENVELRSGDFFTEKIEISVGVDCSVQSMKGVLPFNLQFEVHVETRCSNNRLETQVIVYDDISTNYVVHPNHERQPDAKGNFEIIEVFNSSNSVEFKNSDTAEYIVDTIYKELPMPRDIDLQPGIIPKSSSEEMLTSQKEMLSAMFKTEYLSTKVQRLDELGILLMFSRNESMLFAVRDGELDASWVFNVDGEASEFIISLQLHGESLFLQTSFGIYLVNVQTGQLQSRFEINGAQFYEMQFVADHVLFHWKCGHGSFVSNEARRACHSACPQGLTCDASCDANEIANFSAVISHNLDSSLVVETTDYTCSEMCQRNNRLCVYSKLLSEDDKALEFEEVEKDGSGCEDDPPSDPTKRRDCFCDGETFVKQMVDYRESEFAMERAGGFSVVSEFRCNGEDEASILKLEGNNDHSIHLYAQTMQQSGKAILQFSSGEVECEYQIDGLQVRNWYRVVASIDFKSEKKVQSFFLQDSLVGQRLEFTESGCNIPVSFNQNLAFTARLGSAAGNLNIAGLYAFDRALTETVSNQILQTIKIGARDDSSSLSMHCETCPRSQISTPNSVGPASCGCRVGEYGQCVNVTGDLKFYSDGNWQTISGDVIECPGEIFTPQSSVCSNGKHFSDYFLFNGNCFGEDDEIVDDELVPRTVKEVLGNNKYNVIQEGGSTVELSASEMGYRIQNAHQLRQFLRTSFVTRTDFICKPGPYDNKVRAGSVSENEILAPCDSNEYLNYLARNKKSCEIDTGNIFSKSREILFAETCAEEGEYCFCHGALKYNSTAGDKSITSNSGVLHCSGQDLLDYAGGPCECVGHLSGCLCTDDYRCSFREGTEQETELTFEMQRDHFQPTIQPTCTSCPEGKTSPPDSIGLDACTCGPGEYYGSASDKFRLLDRPSAYDIDGGGWELVRRVKAGSHWHPVADNFAGVDVYGNYSDDETSDETFSKRFDTLTTDDDTEILLATGDAQYWLITRVRYLRQSTNNFENVAAVRTRFNANWHAIKWDSRVGYGEDQWISMNNMDLIDLKNACYQWPEESHRCPVTASSQSDHSDQDPTLATDDNEETFWEGAMNHDQWLRVDMEYSYFVKRVNVTTPSILNDSLKIYIGDYEDATDWRSGKTCKMTIIDNAPASNASNGFVATASAFNALTGTTVNNAGGSNAASQEFEFRCDLRGRYAYIFFDPDDAATTKKIYEVKILGYDANNDRASENYLHPHILYGDHGSHDHIDLVQKHTGANVFVRNPRRSCKSDLEQVQVFKENKKSECLAGEYADSSLVLSEDDIVFQQQDELFRPLAPIPVSLSSSGLTVVTRVMFTAECPAQSCSVFQFGNFENTNLMRLRIENKHVTLSIGNEDLQGPELDYAKWYNVIIRVDYGSHQQHLFVSDFNFSDIYDRNNTITADVSQLKQNLPRNFLNDENDQFNLHVGGFHVFRDFIEMDHAKQIVSGIRIGGTDHGVKDHGVRCSECPQGYTSLEQGASGIQDCFKDCPSDEYADAEGWRVIAQTYIPSQEPFVRHAKKPPFQFINDNFADFADATHVKYECTLGREGTKDNQISSYERIFEINEARQACGAKLYDCGNVLQSPFDFWTAADNSAKFKLEINKVTCMIGEDTNHRFDDPTLGMWGRVSVIRHTDSPDLLSAEGKSVCMICESGKTSESGQKECRTKDVAVDTDVERIDNKLPTNWYQRFMAFPLESFTTEKFYTPPLSKEKLALKQHFDEVYSYFDHNLTHYYKMEEFSLVGDFFPTFQSARYEKTNTDHQHFGFFGYESSAVFVIDEDWLLAFAKLEKINSEKQGTGNFDPFLILRHAKTGKQAFQQISFADQFTNHEIDLISNLVSFKGQYGFDYVAAAFRKQNCESVANCAFLQTTRLVMDRDDPQLYFQHLHDMVFNPQDRQDHDLLNSCGENGDSQCSSYFDSARKQRRIDLEKPCSVSQIVLVSNNLCGQSLWLSDDDVLDQESDLQCVESPNGGDGKAVYNCENAQAYRFVFLKLSLDNSGYGSQGEFQWRRYQSTRDCRDHLREGQIPLLNNDNCEEQCERYKEIPGNKQSCNHAVSATSVGFVLAKSGSVHNLATATSRCVCITDRNWKSKSYENGNSVYEDSQGYLTDRWHGTIYMYCQDTRNLPMQVVGKRAMSTTTPTKLKIVAAPENDGKLVLFQNNLVAVMHPEDNSAVTPIWHDLTYTDGDTIEPWAMDYDATVSTSIKFTIFHQKVNDASLVLAHGGIPPPGMWKTVPNELSGDSDPLYYGIGSQSTSKACFDAHAGQQREIRLQIASSATKRVWGVVTTGITKFELFSSKDGVSYDAIRCERRTAEQYCAGGVEETINKLQFAVDATHVKLSLPVDVGASCLQMGVYVHETWENQDRVLFYEIDRHQASPMSLDKKIDHQLLHAHSIPSHHGDYWIGYYEPDATRNVSRHKYVTYDPKNVRGCDAICQDYSAGMTCSDELDWDFEKVLDSVFENRLDLRVLPKAGIKFKPSKNGMKFQPNTDRYVEMGNFVAFDSGYLTLAARIRINPNAQSMKMYLADLHQIDFPISDGKLKRIELYVDSSRKLCVRISSLSSNQECCTDQRIGVNFRDVLVEIDLNVRAVNIKTVRNNNVNSNTITLGALSSDAQAFSVVLGKQNRYLLQDSTRGNGEAEHAFHGEISALYAWGEKMSEPDLNEVFIFFRQAGVMALTGFMSDNIIEPKFRYDRKSDAGCIGCSDRQYYDIVGNGGLTIIAQVETNSTDDRQTYQVMNTSNVLLKVEIGDTGGTSEKSSARKDSFDSWKQRLERETPVVQDKIYVDTVVYGGPHGEMNAVKNSSGVASIVFEIPEQFERTSVQFSSYTDDGKVLTSDSENYGSSNIEFSLCNESDCSGSNKLENIVNTRYSTDIESNQRFLMLKFEADAALGLYLKLCAKNKPQPVDPDGENSIMNTFEAADARSSFNNLYRTAEEWRFYETQQPTGSCQTASSGLPVEASLSEIQVNELSGIVMMYDDSLWNPDWVFPSTPWVEFKLEDNTNTSFDTVKLKFHQYYKWLDGTANDKIQACLCSTENSVSDVDYVQFNVDLDQEDNRAAGQFLNASADNVINTAIEPDALSGKMINEKMDRLQYDTLWVDRETTKQHVLDTVNAALGKNPPLTVLSVRLTDEKHFDHTINDNIFHFNPPFPKNMVYFYLLGAILTEDEMQIVKAAIVSNRDIPVNIVDNIEIKTQSFKSSSEENIQLSVVGIPYNFVFEIRVYESDYVSLTQDNLEFNMDDVKQILQDNNEWLRGLNWGPNTETLTKSYSIDSNDCSNCDKIEQFDPIAEDSTNCQHQWQTETYQRTYDSSQHKVLRLQSSGIGIDPAMSVTFSSTTTKTTQTNRVVYKQNPDGQTDIILADVERKWNANYIQTYEEWTARLLSQISATPYNSFFVDYDEAADNATVTLSSNAYIQIQLDSTRNKVKLNNDFIISDNGHVEVTTCICQARAINSVQSCQDEACVVKTSEIFIHFQTYDHGDFIRIEPTETVKIKPEIQVIYKYAAERWTLAMDAQGREQGYVVDVRKTLHENVEPGKKFVVATWRPCPNFLYATCEASRSKRDFDQWNSLREEKPNQCLDHKQCREPFLFSGIVDETTRAGPFVNAGNFELMCYTDDQEEPVASLGDVTCESNNYGLEIKLVYEDGREIVSERVTMSESLAVTGAFLTADSHFHDAIHNVYVWDHAMTDDDISTVQNGMKSDEKNSDVFIIGRTMQNGVVQCMQQGQSVDVKLFHQDSQVAVATFDLTSTEQAVHSEINVAQKKVYTLFTNGQLHEWYYENIYENRAEPVLEDFKKYGGVLNGAQGYTGFSLAVVDKSGDVQDVILLDPALFPDANKADFFPPLKRFAHVFVAARDSIAVFDRSGGSLLWDVKPMSHRTDDGDMISSFAVSADGGSVYIVRKGDSGVLESRTLRRWYKSCPTNSDDDRDNLHRCKCLSGFYWDDSLLRARLSDVKTNEYTYDMWVDSKRFEDLLPAQYTIQEEVTPTCRPCPANTSSDRGAYNISGCVCKAGFQGENAESCLPCGVGKYKSEEGFHRCTSCPPGKFSKAVGANSSDVCQRCSLGFYQPDFGSTSCLECPSGTETLSIGTSDIRQCTCQDNFYGIPGARCIQCTKNNSELIHDNETRQESFRTHCTCKEGYHQVENGTMCEPCGVGRYQDGFHEKSFNRLDRLEAALKLDSGTNSTTGSLDVNMTETGGFTVLAKIRVDQAWFMQRVFSLKVYLVDASWFEFELIQQRKFWEQDRDYFTMHVQDSGGALLCKAEIPDDTNTETTHSDEVMLRFDYVNKEISILSHFHEESDFCNQVLDMSSKIVSYEIQFESDANLPESQVSTDAFYLLNYLLQVEEGEGRGAFLAALKDEAINRQDLITVKERKCEVCPDNSYTEKDFNIGATNCRCNPGYERAGADAEAPCVQCDKGKYKIGLGDTECILCPEHMTSNVAGSTDHHNCYCLKGFFGVNDTSCQQCPKGKYGSHVNQTACLDCPAEFYQDETGKTTCKQCPENSITARNGSTSVNDCMCEAPYEYYLRYQSDIVFDSEAETNISALNFLETSAGFDVFFKIDNGVTENRIMHFQGGPNHTIEVEILPGNEKAALTFTSNRTSCIITLRDLTSEHVEITLDQGKPGARSNVEKDYELCVNKNFTFQSYFRANEIEFERSSKAERLIVFKKIVPPEEKEHILRKVQRGRQSRLKLVNQTDFVFKIDTEKAENQVEGLELMVQRDGNNAVKQWATMVDYESVLAYEGSPPAWAWRYTNAEQNPDTKNFGIWPSSSPIAFTSNFEVTLDLGQLRMATGIIFTEVDALSVKKSTDGFLFDDVSVTEYCRKTEDNLCISPFAETQESRYVKVTSSSGSAQSFKIGVFVSQWFPIRSAEYNFTSDEITLKVQMMDDYKPENTTVRATDHTRFLNVSTVKTCNVSSVTKDCFAYRRKERPSTWQTNLQWASQYNARVPWEYELRSYLPSWNETDGNTFPVIPNKWAPVYVYKTTDDAARFGLMQIGVGDDPDESIRCKRNWDRTICAESRCEEEFDQQVTCNTCVRNDASLWRDDCSDEFMQHHSSYLETRCNLDDDLCDQDDKLAGQSGDDLWNEYEFFVQSVSTYEFTIQRSSESVNSAELSFTDTIAEHCNQCPVAKFYSNQTRVCQKCEPGKYQDEVGGTHCKECATGKYQESAEKTACKNCAAGKYQTSLGSKNCTDCSTGKYSNRIGATSFSDCIDCTIGSYQNETGRTSCKNCGNNTTPDPTLPPPYTNISSCYCTKGHSREQECTALQQLVIYDQCSGKLDDSCKCESGTYKGQVAEGLNPCIPCFPGTYSEAGSTGVESCRLCQAGKREKNRLRCELCEDDKVSLDGWARCKDEYPEQIEIRLQLVLNEACVDENTAEFEFDSSLTGKWFEKEGAQCTITRTGDMFVKFIRENCETAQTDFFGANSSMATLHDMLLHESVRRKDISCDAMGLRDYISHLRPLRYKNKEWQLISVMTRCDPNAEWKEGDCKCKPGWTGDGNYHVNHTCIACEAGKYKSEYGFADCLQCPSGKYLEFKNATSETDCSLCAVGKYSELAAATSSLNCTNCLPGTYQDQPGSSECRNCPAGTELNATGSVSLQNCSNCTAGHRSVNPGQARCTKCPSGKFTGFEGQSECTGCDFGKFSEEEGANSSSTCKECLAGTFSDALGNSRCTPCAAGKYSELEGATSDLFCTACAQGKYSQNESATSASVCEACGSGKYQPQTGQTQCIVCPRVDHVPDGSKSTCVECEIGKYAFSGDSTCTQSDGDINSDDELWVKMEVEIDAGVTDEDIYKTLLHLPWVQIYDDREYS